MEFSELPLKCTPTERALIRDELNSQYAHVEFVMNGDGTFTAHIRDVCFEAGSTKELLLELAEMLGES